MNSSTPRPERISRASRATPPLPRRQHPAPVRPRSQRILLRLERIREQQPDPGGRWATKEVPATPLRPGAALSLRGAQSSGRACRRSQRRAQAGAVLRRFDRVPIRPTAQHVGQPRHATAATGRSTSETGPIAPSRRIAPRTASRPIAPRSRWRLTEEDASGEREYVAVISRCALRELQRITLRTAFSNAVEVPGAADVAHLLIARTTDHPLRGATPALSRPVSEVEARRRWLPSAARKATALPNEAVARVAVIVGM